MDQPSEQSENRGFLLPPGCKDLIDALKLQPHQGPMHPSLWPGEIQPLIGELLIPDQTSVVQLAMLLDQKPFRIMADVLRLGLFVTIDEVLSFEIITVVARKYGFIAKRAGAPPAAGT